MRLHFTADDLARVRLWVMGPMAETQWVLRTLRQRPERSLFQGWRRQALRRSPAHAASLGHFLSPLNGGAADLFTMLGRVNTIESGIERLLELPTSRLHSEFRDIPDIANRMPEWLRPVVSGDFQVRRRFAADLTECYRVFIQPHWPRIQAHLSAECDKGARLVAEGGVEQLLGQLHPHLNWRSPTLEMPLYKPFVFDADLHLRGRGLILAPSLFCPIEPQLFLAADDGGSPVLIYPASREPQDVASVLALAGATSSEALGGLLGRTRAAALEELGSSANTTMLAKRIGVSVAAASQHVGVLRQAGLIVSRREQNSVWHSLTPLGRALLEEDYRVSA
jgi:DNA-binding transcriptional ArsR family regulator